MLKSYTIIILTLLFLQSLTLVELYRGLLVAVILGGLGLVCYRFRDKQQRNKDFAITTFFDLVGSTSVTLGLSPFIFELLQERGWKINYPAVVFFGFLAMLFGWQIRPIIIAITPLVLSIKNLGTLQTDVLKTLEELKEEKRKHDTLSPDKKENE